MIGLIVLVCVLIMFGFVYVWIANVVAHEDVSVGIGVAILILTGIANFVINLLLLAALGTVLTMIVGTATNFLVLAGMTRLLAKIPFKQSLIIAGIFTVLMFLLALGLRACTAAA